MIRSCFIGKTPSPGGRAAFDFYDRRSHSGHAHARRTLAAGKPAPLRPSVLCSHCEQPGCYALAAIYSPGDGFSVDRQPGNDNADGLDPSHRDFVTALATGLEIIRAFDAEHPRMTLSEVAARTGMNRAKARRFLLTLHGLGYMRRHDRYFELAPRTLQLGYAFLSANNFQSVIRQHLEHITESTGESSSMGVLDGADVIYVARSAAPHRLMTIALSVGTHLPAAATSMGRMLLATLAPADLDARLSGLTLKNYTPRTVTEIEPLRAQIERARERGYCIVDQELESGLRSLAVPVRNTGGRLLGAINVSTNAARINKTTLTREFLPLLQRVSRDIESQVD
jgi:IclR family pca regulon transcriptional regulator